MTQTSLVKHHHRDISSATLEITITITMYIMMHVDLRSMYSSHLILQTLHNCELTAGTECTPHDVHQCTSHVLIS